MADKQIIETELECVKRQQCDRDCGKCDLVMDSDEIARAYDHAIELLDAEERGELVRVVRCKDCKYCVAKTVQEIFEVGNWCEVFNFSTQPNHYCASAEAALADMREEG